MAYLSERMNKFRWPVSVSQKIKASPQDIWLPMADAGNLNACHPFCEKNLVLKWPGVGSKDVIHYYSGWVMQREFVNWIDGVGYDLYIGREGGRKSFVSWRITNDQQGAKLRITIFPHTLQKIPSIIRWIPHFVVLHPGLHSYLESVLKGFEWYITTGKPVSKDQFGTHKWFSNNDS